MGVMIAALAGVLLGIPVLRLRGDYLAVVSHGPAHLPGVAALVMRGRHLRGARDHHGHHQVQLV